MTSTCPPAYKLWFFLFNERFRLRKKLDRPPKIMAWDIIVHSKSVKINKNHRLEASEDI